LALSSSHPRLKRLVLRRASACPALAIVGVLQEAAAFQRPASRCRLHRRFVL